MFEDIEFHFYSKGIKGFLEKLWNRLRFKTTFIPEPIRDYGWFKGRRAFAGHYISEPRWWYKPFTVTHKRREE